MDLPDIGEIVTPVDDPCQYNPAWRSILSGYLFSTGRCSDSDLDSISKTGCVTVTQQHKKREPVNRSKTKKGKVKKGQDDIRYVPVFPFNDNPQYRVFVMDKWIRGQLGMMRDMSFGGQISDESVPFKLAYRWYSEPDNEAAIKKRIEPLLLTDIGIDIITMDLIGLPSAQPALEAYEKMYFNCRDDSFSLSQSMQLIERFAMPWGPLKPFLRKWETLDADGFCVEDGRPIAKDSDVWRAVGATMGYEALMYLWKWENKAHGLKDKSLQRMMELSWKASVSRLLSDLYTGTIAHEDAARVLSSYTAQAKFICDEKRGGGTGGGSDTVQALMAVLYQTSPHLVAMDAEETEQRNEEIQSRIASQLAISKQAIEDKGEQVNAEVMDAQIANAIE